MLTVSALVGVCTVGFAAAPTNYAGTYSGQASKGARSQPAAVLRVIQNDDVIEITRDEGGRTTTSRFPLNGQQGDYTSPRGSTGKGKVDFKGKGLAIESIVLTRPQSNGPGVRSRIRERWQLSPDAKLLTIRFNVDFPDLEQLTHGATDQTWMETYTRTDAQ